MATLSSNVPETFCAEKVVTGACSRSTSAGSSTKESSGSDGKRSPKQSSDLVVAGPPGLPKPLRAPPGLEDATPAAAAAFLGGMPQMQLCLQSAIAMPSLLPFPMPPPSCGRFLPPPPLQAPVLGPTLTALPQPPALPPLLSGMPAAVSTPPPQPPVLPPQMQFLPPPPLLPPVLNAQTRGPQFLPPAPCSTVAVMQPPPAQAPILSQEMQAPSIPLPPSSAPVLHLVEASSAPSGSTTNLPSIGSAEHCLGTCRPCAFFHAKGCSNGVNCIYCHLCDAGEKKRRMKEKRESLRRESMPVV